MVVLANCNSIPKDFPRPPKVNLKQTLYQQTICNADKTECVVVDKCQFWQLNSKNEWVKVGEGPLKNSDLSKSCHGSFGVSAKELNAYQEWVRRVQKWGQVNCNGSNDN